MANYEILGTYKIDITRESLASAAKHYGWADDWLTETGELKEDVWLWYLDERAKEKDTIALIEATIKGVYSESELLRLTHGPLEQAPYLEFYLDETGTEKIAYEKAVSMDVRRICFFLHSVDVSLPLNIKQGKKVVQTLSLPQVTKLPERLKPFCFYIPYD